MSSKPPTTYSRAGGRQRLFCCYCLRQLDPAKLELPTSLTFDHVLAESRGGVTKVPCCRKCNFLKDDIHVEDWRWFMATHPRWWKLFDYPLQVKSVIREFRVAQAHARARDAKRMGWVG